MIGDDQLQRGSRRQEYRGALELQRVGQRRRDIGRMRRPCMLEYDRPARLASRRLVYQMIPGIISLLTFVLLTVATRWT
jgi:hypothetical protein